MQSLRSTRRLSTLADSCCRRRDGAGGAACAWTDVWCMLCRSQSPDCLVALSSRQRQTTRYWGHLRGRSSARFVCVPGRAWRLLPQTALLGQPSPAPICLWVRAMAKMVQTVQRSVAAAVSAALACLAPSVHALSRGFGACCPVPVSGPGRRLQHGTPLSALWALYVDICRATHAANYQQHK